MSGMRWWSEMHARAIAAIHPDCCGPDDVGVRGRGQGSSAGEGGAVSELQNDHTDMLAAAEWAAEIFAEYGRQNPDCKDGVHWMTRGMLVFLGLMDVSSEMQVGEARTMTLTECIERGKDLLERMMEESDRREAP